MIIGIDEVGRGAWAGPLVVAAVGLDGAEIAGLTDSKLLTKRTRERLALAIKQSAPRIGIGWVSARDIDGLGLSAALKCAAQRAIAQIDVAHDDQIIIDGTVNLLSATAVRATLMKKADLLVPSVSAASVIAKVARDHYMALCDRVFPGYGLSSHVGYGAAAHREAVQRLGVLPIHRRSFAPIAALLGQTNMHTNSQLPKNAQIDELSLKPLRPRKNTSRTGSLAEHAAAQYLTRAGYTIVERNWKTKWCEIDIIAMRKNIMYFVEVKYRKSTRQGGGIAAITPKKLGQMRFAARLWLHGHGEIDARLSAIEVTGEEMVVTRFEENV